MCKDSNVTQYVYHEEVNKEKSHLIDFVSYMAKPFKFCYLQSLTGVP